MGLRRSVLSGLPVFVWLAAIVGVLMLLPYGRRSSQIVGVVETVRHPLVVPIAGRVVAVSVVVHQPVAAGQLVARLAADDVLLRLAAARNELEAMRADLSCREAELEQEALSLRTRIELDASVEVRRRTSEIESARLDELQVKADIEEARIRLRGLAIETGKIASLETQGIASDTARTTAMTEHDAVQCRIAELESMLVEHRTRVASARERLQTFTAREAYLLPRDKLLEPLRWRMKAQEVELERIAYEARQLDLVAPCSGYVESVLCTDGQWVAGGVAIATITDPAARRIRAYVDETMRDALDVARGVRVLRPRRPGHHRTAAILSISPAMVLMPQRLWRDPRQEQWAFELVLATEDDEAPGEMVSLLPRARSDRSQQ